jgi:hypothetical protein
VSCVLVVAIGYLRSRAEVRGLHAEIDLLTEENRKLRSQLANAEKSREFAERSLQKLEAQNSTRPSPQRRNLQGFDGLAMFRTPAYKPLWRKRERRAVMHAWGGIILSMKLPPEQVSKLLDLMVEQAESAWDANEASQLANLPNDQAEKARHAAENVVNDEIKALVGQSNADLLQMAESFPGPHAPWVVQSTIGLDLALAGAPLSPEQFSVMVHSYDEARLYPGPVGGVPDDETPDPATGLTPYFSAMLDRLSQSLSPDQIAVVKNDYIEQIQLQQYQQQLAPRAP